MILWSGSEVAPRKLWLAPRQDARQILRGVRLRVAVDEIILAVLDFRPEETKKK